MPGWVKLTSNINSDIGISNNVYDLIWINFCLITVITTSTVFCNNEHKTKTIVIQSVLFTSQRSNSIQVKVFSNSSQLVVFCNFVDKFHCCWQTSFRGCHFLFWNHKNRRKKTETRHQVINPRMHVSHQLKFVSAWSSHSHFFHMFDVHSTVWMKVIKNEMRNFLFIQWTFLFTKSQIKWHFFNHNKNNQNYNFAYGKFCSCSFVHNFLTKWTKLIQLKFGGIFSVRFVYLKFVC